MGIIAFIILGAIAGAIAKALLLGDDSGRVHHHDAHRDRRRHPRRLPTPRLLRCRSDGRVLDLSSWLTAIVGSIALLPIYRAVAGRSSTRATV